MSDDSGKYFSMSDGEAKGSSRSRQNSLKSEFLDRARSFMDDTALGEGRQALKKWWDKTKAMAEEGALDEPDDDDDYEYYYEDDDEEYDDFDEEYDMSDPENIRVGYAKPGTVERARRKTLEEAQDESFDLKLGALSGLLERFGAEGQAEEEKKEQPKLEIDKPLFKKWFRKIEWRLSQFASVTDWLFPPFLILLREGAKPPQILKFIIAGVFARTDENYLTEGDIRYIKYLARQVGLKYEEELIEQRIAQIFLFPQRVYQIYQELLKEPIEINQEGLDSFAQAMAKMYIHRVSKRWNCEHKEILKVLAKAWVAEVRAIQEALPAREKALEQYRNFQKKKMITTSVWKRLLERDRVLNAHWDTLADIAEELYWLRQVTAFLEEDEALKSLSVYDLSPFGFPEERSLTLTGLYLLINEEPDVEEKQLKILAPLGKHTTSALSPLNQKRTVSRAKQGQMQALKAVEAYKEQKVQGIMSKIWESK